MLGLGAHFGQQRAPVFATVDILLDDWMRRMMAAQCIHETVARGYYGGVNLLQRSAGRLGEGRDVVAARTDDAKLAGVLIEAHPALCKTGTAHKVCGACPEHVTMRLSLSGATGTLTDFASEEYVDVEKDIEHGQARMPDILSEAGILDVDFISIDGAEEVVLKTCNTALTGVVLVEADGESEESHGDGFVPIPHVLQQQKKIVAGYNELFVRKSLCGPHGKTRRGALAVDPILARSIHETDARGPPESLMGCLRWTK